MIGVTVFGLLFTPVFYVVIQRAKADTRTPANTKEIPEQITENDHA